MENKEEKKPVWERFLAGMKFGVEALFVFPMAGAVALGRSGPGVAILLAILLVAVVGGVAFGAFSGAVLLQGVAGIPWYVTLPVVYFFVMGCLGVKWNWSLR